MSFLLLIFFFFGELPSPSNQKAPGETVRPLATQTGQETPRALSPTKPPSPPQTALPPAFVTRIPPRGHKIWQERRQLIREVATAQGHRLVPLPGGFILVLRPPSVALSHLRTAARLPAPLFTSEK